MNRRNTEDARGRSWFVYDDDGQRIAGPFGSATYAETVAGRMDDHWDDPYIDTR